MDWILAWMWFGSLIDVWCFATDFHNGDLCDGPTALTARTLAIPVYGLLWPVQIVFRTFFVEKYARCKCCGRFTARRGGPCEFKTKQAQQR